MSLVNDLKGALNELQRYLDTTSLAEAQKTEIMSRVRSLEHIALAGGAATATLARLQKSDEVTLAPDHAKLVPGPTPEQMVDGFLAHAPESDHTDSGQQSELAKHQQVTGRFGDDKMG